MTQPAQDPTPEIPSESLRTQLLDPASWREGLENYALATHLAVALVDTRGKLLGEYLNPAHLWSAFAAGREESGCAFSISPREPCTCIADALAAGKPVFVRDGAGFVHFAVPLLLYGHPLGGVIAGQVFDQYPETMPLDRAAGSAGLSPGDVWRLARLEHPISRVSLNVYAKLLAVLVDDFLRARYHSIIEAERRLAEASKLRDIAVAELTQRQRAEEALRQSEDRLQATFNQAAIGMALIGLDGRFLQVNQKMSEIVGYSREELLGLTGLEITPRDDRSRDCEAIDRLLAGKVAEFSIEKQYVRKNGTRVWVSVTMALLRDAAGQPQFMIGIIEDISPRIRAEQERALLLAAERSARAEAELANQLKDQFLATVSHELRTPLTAMLGWSRLLRSGELTDPERERALETIQRNAEVQARLIEDILDVSRIVSGKLRLDLRSVELGQIVEDVATSLRPAAEEKGLRLEAELSPSPCTVWGDPRRLQQIVWNLLCNAVKFTPAGGRVVVRFRRTDSHAEITVADSGEGIGPDFLPHVFEPFRQADASASREHGGLGLGLAIVRQLVDLHRGTVRVDSPGKGQGATFTVALPCEPVVAVQTIVPQRPPESVGQANPSASLLEGFRVLVVDDEPDARALLSAVLTQYGAQVTAAASAHGALEAFDRFQPDVLISDIGMPGEDGYSLIRKVRADEKERGTRSPAPAIALTAYAREEDRLEALAAGYQLQLAKPIDPADLVKAVAVVARPSADLKGNVRPSPRVA